MLKLLIVFGLPLLCGLALWGAAVAARRLPALYRRHLTGAGRHRARMERLDRELEEANRELAVKEFFKGDGE